MSKEKVEVSLSIQTIAVLVGLLIIGIGAFALIQFGYQNYGVLAVIFGVILIFAGIPQKKNE